MHIADERGTSLRVLRALVVTACVAGSVVALLVTAAPARAASTLQQFANVRGSVSATRTVPFKWGAYRKQPVIVIQLEAFQTLLVGKKVNGRYITPNLNKLVNRSYYFPNLVPQMVRGNTSDIEWAVNSGLNPPPRGAAAKEYASRSVPGLPRLLASKLGYRTLTAHANRAVYWNRIELYPSLGFQRYYDMSYFGMQDQMWYGTSDKAFFRKSVPLIRAARASKKPYYAFLVSMSSHHPFTHIPQYKRPLKLSAAQRTSEFGQYLSSCSYTDAALGQFINDLKRAGIYDKAIIVVYGDHWAINSMKANKQDLRLMKSVIGHGYCFADKVRAPLVIHLPRQYQSVVSTQVLGDVDIMPTIADLVGLDMRKIPSAGRSAFQAHSRLVTGTQCLPYGSFVNNRIVFRAGSRGWANGKAYVVGSTVTTRTTAADKADYNRAAALRKLSDRYVRRLPKRPGATFGRKGLFPVSVN